jgi:WD40 repeat protein
MSWHHLLYTSVLINLRRFLGRFLKNFSGHASPINALAVNEDGVAVSCGDNGSIDFWDYETGYCFQKSTTIVQPGKRCLPSQLLDSRTLST